MRRGPVRRRLPHSRVAAPPVVGQAAAPGSEAEFGGGGIVTASVEVGIDHYRTLLESVFDERVVAWTAEAEASEHFPRALIEHLGASGVFAHKWGDSQHPDVAKLVALAFQLGQLGSAG